MVWDISDYEEPEVRVLPVILLLDTSGSMQRKFGEASKIDKLNEAVKNMMEAFQHECEMENFIKVTVYAFNNDVYRIGDEHCEPADFLRDFQPMEANGMTYLGKALDAAKNLIDDKEKTLGRWYRPAVVLVSDGAPNGSWQEPMQRFLTEGRTTRTQRFAIAIGAEGIGQQDMLLNFTGVKIMCFWRKMLKILSKILNLSL